MTTEKSPFPKYLHVFLLFGFILVLSQACSTSATKEPIPSATVNTGRISPTAQSPTHIPSIASPTIEPIVESSPSPTTFEAGKDQFEKVSDDLGEIRSLWVDPEGQLWVGSKIGIFIHQVGGWEMRYQGPVEKILGADANGVVWVILEGETQIAAFDNSQTWQVFGAEQGWTPPAEIEYLSPGYGDGLATDPQGRVWLATGRDEVRVFDLQLQTWTVLTAEDIGYTPSVGEDYQGHFLSDVQLSRSQKVWVADCIAEGELLKGQGIRWTDGVDWFLAPDTAAECVLDVEMDDTGKMWVGGFDDLLMYDPDLGYWTRYPLPDWERGQLVTEIDLDNNGSPWVEVLQFGGAGPLGSVVRYHLDHDEWIKDFEGWFSSLAFGRPGIAWLCSEGAIFRLQNGQAEQLGEIPGTQCDIQVDDSGRVWSTNYSDLWLYNAGD